MSDHLAGWYPDPSGDQTKLRYWNGEQWTDDFTNAPQAANQGYGSYASGYQQPASNPTYYPQAVADNSDSTLRLIAFIFYIITIAGLVFSLLPSLLLSIIPLAWTIPMAIICWGTYQGTRPNTVAFGVCTFIFGNPISGILLLVSRKDV